MQERTCTDVLTLVSIFASPTLNHKTSLAPGSTKHSNHQKKTDKKVVSRGVWVPVGDTTGGFPRVLQEVFSGAFQEVVKKCFKNVLEGILEEFQEQAGSIVRASFFTCIGHMQLR